MKLFLFSALVAFVRCYEVAPSVEADRQRAEEMVNTILTPTMDMLGSLISLATQTATHTVVHLGTLAHTVAVPVVQAAIPAVRNIAESGRLYTEHVQAQRQEILQQYMDSIPSTDCKS